MRILVTGLDGFTGQYAGAELRGRGHDVVGLKADLRDKTALKAEIEAMRPDAVLHLAAIAFVGHGDADAFYAVNLLGTRNLLEALQGVVGLQSILLASSANIYGNTASGLISEDHPPNPANDYAVSKLAMEHMAGTFAHKLPISIVRPFNYTGRGQSEDFLIPKIVAHFRARAPKISLGNTDVARDFGDVRTVVGAYADLIEKAVVGETLNICTGLSTSLDAVLEMCTALSGHKMDVVINPDFVRDNEVKTLTGDKTRLGALLGPRSGPSLEDTLAWMLAEA